MPRHSDTVNGRVTKTDIFDATDAHYKPISVATLSTLLLAIQAF